MVYVARWLYSYLALPRVLVIQYGDDRFRQGFLIRKEAGRECSVNT